MSSERKVSVSRHIDASPGEIFEVLTDTRGHVAIDGSGTVQDDIDSVRLEMGTKFGMKMRFGVPYRIKNTVVEFEPDRLIAWRHFGRHRWRYELEPDADGTLVTETFDWSTSPFAWGIERAGYPDKHPASMEKTLERLETEVQRRREAAE